MAAGAKYDGVRAQRTDRAGEAANKALQRQKSKAAGDAVFFELFGEDTAGVRPEVFAPAAKTGSAAHHGANRRLRLLLAYGADSPHSCAAAGRTAGGSADDHILFFSAPEYGAKR